MTYAERFNTVHVAAGSANGGEFGSTGGGGSAKPAAGHGGHGASHPAPHSATGPPRHTLAYNPKTKTGAGYGMPHGDPNVKQLQAKCNALGLTDSHGKTLQVDGRLGPLTTSSIKALQKRLGVKADGQVSPEFFAKVLALKSLPPPHHRSTRGVETAHPGATERLHEYWVHGEGAAKIAWGSPGDFDRCVGELGKHISDPQGYCNLAHHAALGYYPATHAKMDGHRSEDQIHMPTKEDLQTVGRNESLSPYVRSFMLEDVSVRTGKTGREVTAYAAVFNTPTEIQDQDGHYVEELDPVAFNRAISDSAPAGGRTNWRVGVFYNHGMTLHGTPSDRHSMPIGVPLEIKPDGRGLLTKTMYHRSDFADEIVEGLESGAIPGYSFSGRFLRSNPLIPRGGFRTERGGNLRTVRRMESTLKEYGPTPFPAYPDAAILGVRSDSLLGAMAADPELAMRMLNALRDGAPLDSPPRSGAPEHRDSPPEDSHTVRSGRSVKEELAARRSAFLQKYGSRDV